MHARECTDHACNHHQHCITLQGEEGRLYEDLGRYDLMKPVVEELLAEYNSKKKPMNLVFFDDAIEHLTRIHRILRLQQVSLLTSPNMHRVSQHCHCWRTVFETKDCGVICGPWLASASLWLHMLRNHTFLSSGQLSLNL